MKILNILFIFLLISLLTSCFNMDSDVSNDPISKVNLVDLVTAYQEKITKIIENDESSNQLTSAIQPNMFSYEEDPYYIAREAFLDVYHVQRDNHQDVKLSPFLMIYKDLLDNVMEEMEAQDIESIEAQIFVSFRDFLDMEAHVSITNDQSLLVKLSINIDQHQYHYGIKFGYDNGNFYLRELIMRVTYNSFEYFEFLENNHMIDIRYSSESYWYRYVNQNDNTYYEISKRTTFLDNDFHLSWYNPITSIRTRISRSFWDNLNQIEWFNEKGAYFTYLEYLDSDKVDVAWQLLEATGWDGVYYEENTTNPHNGIYKDGVKIFGDAKLNVDLYYYANVRVQYSFLKSELTNEILNLSHYGLSSNSFDITLESVQHVLENSLLESSYLSVYKGIDFLNDDLSQSLFAVIDNDIKP